MKRFCSTFKRQETDKKTDPLLNMVTAEIRSNLLEKYKYSEYSRMARSRMQKASIVVIYVIINCFIMYFCSDQIIYCIFNTRQ